MKEMKMILTNKAMIAFMLVIFISTFLVSYFEVH